MSDLDDAKTLWLGTWRNEKSSTMRIADIKDETIAPNKKVHLRIVGTYQSAAGSVPSTQSFPLTGFVLGDIITFSVSFHVEHEGKDRKSMTAWAGQYLPVTRDNGSHSLDDTREILKTLWHLVPDFADGESEDEYGWVIAWAGSDNFRKVSSDPKAG